MKYTLQLEKLPPSTNALWRVYRKKLLMSRVYRQFQEVVQHQLTCPVPLEGELGFVVRVWPRDRRRRDLDNLFKAALDTLEKRGAFGDDRQVSRINAKMCRCRKCPFAYDCTVFTLKKMECKKRKRDQGHESSELQSSELLLEMERQLEQWFTVEQKILEMIERKMENKPLFCP